MDQPLFSCTKCFRNFPQSEMSRSGQTCKGCNPHHSTFKQCEFCKSDFKYYLYGTICPRCQSLKLKYGDPQPCSICHLKTAFGNALVCQRCLHYRVKFGEPRECQTCGQMCAFLKDEASRQKVDGQILCWVCTYNFKLARSRERSDHGSSKRRNETSDSGRLKLDRGDPSKRPRSDDYNSSKPDSTLTGGNQPIPSTQTQSLDSVYNEHLLTIGQLQDEVKALKRQLAQKDAEMLGKDRTIAELRSELIEMKDFHENRLMKARAAAQLEQDRLTATIRQLQKEKVSITQSMKKRKSQTNLVAMSSLRYSNSAVALFNPDSPIQVSSNAKTATTATSGTPGSSSTEKSATPYKRLTSKPVPLTDDESTVDSAKSSPAPVKVDDEKPVDHSPVREPSNRPVPSSSDEDPTSTPRQPTEQSTVASTAENTDHPKRDGPSSPELTPSLSSSEAATDDEASQQHPPKQTHSRAYLTTDSKDPLGLDTPSESEEEEDEQTEGEQTVVDS